jgi:hypothetical protein
VEINNDQPQVFEVDVLDDGALLIVSEPVDSDVEDLAANMREADRREVFKYSAESPREALLRAIDLSTLARVALVDGRVVAMWGLVAHSLMAGVGSPWCLTSNEVHGNRREFARRSRGYLEELLRVCPRMGVQVDAEYEVACRWLRRLGFSLAPVEVNGHEFYNATIAVEEVA